MVPVGKIKVFNTLTRKEEEFKPLKEKEVRIYGCGPTVYNYVHIGNFRSFVFYDFIRRVFEFNNYKVKFIINITDVDDKTIRDSKKLNKPFTDFVNYWERVFYDQIKELNIKNPTFFPRATAHIAEMTDIIQRLLDKDVAYLAEDGIYYSIKKFKDYGKLSKINLENLEVGKRVNQDEYSKENPQDFALWKFWKEEDGEVFWKIRVLIKKDKIDNKLLEELIKKGIILEKGERENYLELIIKGRPGWHIECSAMSTKYLGKTFDIHLGGIDLIFPHHENEIAQSEAAFGQKFVNYWIHINHLLVNGKKMSKSLGNFYTLKDIEEKGFNPLALRLFYLMSHYRSQQNFTFEALKSAEEKLDYINETYQNYKILKENSLFKKEANNEKLKELYNKIIEKINEDFNTPEALSIYFELLEEINKSLKKREDPQFFEELIKLTNDLFGLIDNKKTFFFIKKEEELNEDDYLKYLMYEIEDKIKDMDKKERIDSILKLVKLRNYYRNKKEFIKADLIREKLKELGVKLDDWPEGTKVVFSTNLLEN
jgi:cysteinyl-tRNA synthetase